VRVWFLLESRTNESRPCQPRKDLYSHRAFNRSSFHYNHPTPPNAIASCPVPILSMSHPSKSTNFEPHPSSRADRTKCIPMRIRRWIQRTLAASCDIPGIFANRNIRSRLAGMGLRRRMRVDCAMYSLKLYGMLLLLLLLLLKRVHNHCHCHCHCHMYRSEIGTTTSLLALPSTTLPPPFDDRLPQSATPRLLHATYTTR